MEYLSLLCLKSHILLNGTVHNKRSIRCSVNFVTSLEKAHVVASSSAPFTNNIQDSDEYKPKFLELFLDII